MSTPPSHLRVPALVPGWCPCLPLCLRLWCWLPDGSLLFPPCSYPTRLQYSFRLSMVYLLVSLPPSFFMLAPSASFIAADINSSITFLHLPLSFSHLVLHQLSITSGEDN